MSTVAQEFLAKAKALLADLETNLAKDEAAVAGEFEFLIAKFHGDVTEAASVVVPVSATVADTTPVAVEIPAVEAAPAAESTTEAAAEAPVAPAAI